MKKIILSLCIIVSTAFAQKLVIKVNDTLRTIPSLVSNVAVTSVNNTIIQSADQSEKVRLIVQLKGPARIEQKITGKVFSKAAANTTRQDILKMDAETQVVREFETVINGFAVVTKRENIRTIASLSDVLSVFPDVAVSASPVSTAIAAPPVQKNTVTAATGKGIRIGIIDTGIDYHHEAFGSGIGNGYTTAGGYDFVNNDSDPMDDNGHGTHVAGIIAGHSSTITGAAKDSRLYAYKVLDQNGNGAASSVIAAIERAISDSVQVINLSLGTPSGSADDPISTAVNRAVRAGIVVVVAAGNSGEYSSINSPGVAEFALTVGATDNASVASFSSKGPETETYSIKPDIVAPGVNVLSAKLGGGYIAMSGTSMAAPYVTSLVAGMKELHPGWNAIQLKDAVISNSVDLGNSLFSQGHGKIDEHVLSGNGFASPAQLSFGFNPPAAVVWKEERRVTLSNYFTEKRTYRFVSLSTNPAIQFHFTPQQIEIAPADTAGVTVELETNNLYLMNNSTFENGYSGKLLAISSTDTIIIPFAFFKGPVMQIHFNEIPWLVMVHNQKNFSRTLSPKTNTISLVLNDGTYDVISSFYGSRIVARENVTLTGKSYVEISSADALFPVSFEPIDGNGNVLDLNAVHGTYSYLESFVHQSTGFAIVGMGGGKINAYSAQPKYFSNISKNYTYGYSITLQPDNHISYTYDIIVDTGITVPLPVKFLSSEMKHLDVKYSLSSNVQRAFPITWTSFIGKYSTVAVTYYDGSAAPMTFPFTQQSFYTQRKDQFPLFHQREAYSY